METNQSSIAENLHQVRQRIDAACALACRDPHTVRLLAVSKTCPGSAVRAAHAAGQAAFGENYVQEGLAKIDELSDLRPSLAWHLIGPLQSNKTRAVAEAFDWVHGVDRLKIAQRLSEQRPAGLPPLNICLQVNASGEASKGGVCWGEVPALAWLMLAANTLWTIAYDTEYAMVDRADDLKIGIKTSAITFGRFDVAAVMLCYAAAIGLLGVVGLLIDAGVVYYLGLAAAAGIAGYHYTLIRARERAHCFKAFRHNNWFGAAVFAGIVA